MACKIFDRSKLSPCKNSRRESVYENFVEIVQNRSGTTYSQGQDSKRPVIITRIKSRSNLFIFLVCLVFFVLFRVDFTHLVLSLLTVVPARF